MRLKGLSIVIPAHNEEANIKRAVENAVQVAGETAEEWEIIVVDDGSTDSTGEKLSSLWEKYPGVSVITNETNRGYGASLVRGFAAARLEWVFTTDADNQFDMKELSLFVNHTTFYDFLMGFRKNRKDSFARKFLAWGFNLLVDWMFKVKVRDVDCAFKLIKRSLLERMKLTSRDFFIDTEIIARAKRLGCRVYQRSVTHYPRIGGETTVRPSNIPRTIREMLRIYRKSGK